MSQLFCDVVKLARTITCVLRFTLQKFNTEQTMKLKCSNFNWTPFCITIFLKAINAVEINVPVWILQLKQTNPRHKSKSIIELHTAIVVEPPFFFGRSLHPIHSEWKLLFFAVRRNEYINRRKQFLAVNFGRCFSNFFFPKRCRKYCCSLRWFLQISLL